MNRKTADFANKKKKIVAVGPNPAWQKALVFKKIENGRVNRAIESLDSAAGKAVNLARASKVLGADPLIIQFAGGKTGRMLLDEIARDGLRHKSVRTRSETRTCVTCIDLKNDRTTELIQPSGKITHEELEEMHSAFDASIEKASFLAICGTYPPGVPANFYFKLASKAKKMGIPVFFDSSCPLDAKLLAMIDILKVNSEEVKLLAGKSSVLEAGRYLIRGKTPSILAVTDGGESALLFVGGREIEFKPPKIKTVNCIGAGDTVSGVFLCGLLDGVDACEAFGKGICAGTASCLNLKPALFDPSICESLFSEMKLKRTYLEIPVF